MSSAEEPTEAATDVVVESDVEAKVGKTLTDFLKIVICRSGTS